MSARHYKRDGLEGQLARKLWVEVQATEKEVCAQVGITAKSLRRWRDWFGWDEQRKAQGAGMALLQASVTARLGKLAHGLENPDEVSDGGFMDSLKEANQLLATIERIKKLDRDIDYKRLALRWSREFADYLTARDPAALEPLAPHLKTFAAEIVNG